jgi:predicted DNA-binding transcriptional regulator AlpA
MTTDDRLITRTELAAMLGYKPQTIARWKWAGQADRPPEVRLGHRIRYRLSDVRRWITEHSERPSDDSQAGSHAGA